MTYLDYIDLLHDFNVIDEASMCKAKIAIYHPDLKVYVYSLDQLKILAKMIDISSTYNKATWRDQ